MKAETILQSNVLDIVFENRNKAYGAYELRKFYHKRLFKSIGIMMLLIVLFVIFAAWRTSSTIAKPIDDWRNNIKLTTVELPKELEQEKKKTEKASAKPKTPVASTPLTSVIQIVTNPVKPIADIDQLDTTARGPETQGPGTGGVVLVPVGGDDPYGGETGDGKLQSANNTVIDDNQPLSIAEEMPEFPGGKAALIRFMQRNLRQPDDFEDGQKEVILARFVVNKDGYIDNVELLKNGRDDLDNEVIRVIKKMPVWKPGKQNGRHVPVYFNLPVTFVAPE